MLYFITFLVLLALYVGGILLSKRLAGHSKIVNQVFVILIFLCYLYTVIYMYNDVGISDWNFLNTLPTANVSPFMFCLVIVFWILPKKVRPSLFMLVSLLSLGMLVAGLGGCFVYIARDYKFHWTIALDCTAHVLISLWGIYLIKSGQMELNVKKASQNGIIIVCVALGMLIHNLAFDTAFFGLSLNGKHSIYNIVITNNSIVSAFVYFVGLFLVLKLGYAYQKILNMSKK